MPWPGIPPSCGVPGGEGSPETLAGSAAGSEIEGGERFGDLGGSAEAAVADNEAMQYRVDTLTACSLLRSDHEPSSFSDGPASVISAVVITTGSSG